MIRALVLCAVLPALSACGNLGDRRQPIPTLSKPAVAASARTPLVIVLPGRRDNVAVLSGRGVADAIQAAWPQAEVVLTSATLDYYLDGGLARRIHEQVVLPALAGGDRPFYLVGASMGGLGVLLYDQAYPGVADGLVLLAPFLGNARLLREIESAGGIAAWQPGPSPQAVDRGNFQRELWRHLQTWPVSGRGDSVWLAWGDRDRLRRAVPVIAPLLPPEQMLERAGGHAWTVWTPAAAEIFTRIAAHTGADAKRPD
ncbi:MAG: alpha/beta hydrolase [Xanthomonadales bacterium]|nr:alpha/beta hydrolase [Xanthomonadales bacterium]